jgi:transposase-like protein
VANDLFSAIVAHRSHFTLKLQNISHVLESRSRALSKRGRGTYEADKPPVFTLVDRGTGQRYVVPAKSADEATVRLLLDNHKKESLTVYTDGFRAYDPLENDENFHREAVIHGDGEYVDGDAHVNTCESHRRWRDGGSRRIEASQRTN